jgi:hypothetical protein
MKIPTLLICLVALLAASCSQAVQTPAVTQNQQAAPSGEIIPEGSPTQEPTAALPEPAAPVDCANEDAANISAWIAEDYSFTSSEQVLVWFCSGFEFEDILTALETQDQTGVAAEDLFDMLAQGLNWNEIWLSIGLTE